MSCKLRCDLLTRTAQNEVAKILRWQETMPTSRAGFPAVSDMALVLLDNLTECWGEPKTFMFICTACTVRQVRQRILAASLDYY